MRKTTDAAKDATADQGATAWPETTAIDTMRFKLLHSAIYHTIMQQSCTRMSRLIAFTVITLGSGAVLALGDFDIYGVSLSKLAGLMIALLGAIQIVWDFGGQAQIHKELKARFYALLAEVEAGGEPRPIESRMVEIFASEPPTRQRVNIIAHNMAGESVFGPGNFNKT